MWETLGPFVISLFVVAPIATEPAPGDLDAPITITLERVKELRRLDLVPEGDGYSMLDQPGLELRFAIAAAGGRKIVEIREPTSVRATDSTGTDLAVLLATGYGQPRHVQTIQNWEEAPHAFTFTLGLPARAADAFSLVAALETVTYLDADEKILAPRPQWTPVPRGVFEEGDVRMRLETTDNGVNLVFEPATVHDVIDDVELLDDATPLEHQGRRWNSRQVAYMFIGAVDGGARIRARVTVRRGLTIAPIAIELHDEPLP